VSHTQNTTEQATLLDMTSRLLVRRIPPACVRAPASPHAYCRRLVASLPTTFAEKRAHALRILGCRADETDRAVMRERYYTLAKAHHPDVPTGCPETFRQLADAWDLLSRRAASTLQADDATTPRQQPNVDPLAVFLGVREEERQAALRRELRAATALSSGGLDRGGAWMMTEMLAALDNGAKDDEAVALPVTPIGGGGGGPPRGGAAERQAPSSSTVAPSDSS